MKEQKLSDAIKILKEAHYICEYENRETIRVPIYVNSLLNSKGETLRKSFDVTCKLGLTPEEEKEIEKILPGFTKHFDAEYDATGGDGNSIEVEVCYTGESPSWDGRDFGTYDPGWGDIEVIDDDDTIRRKVTDSLEMTIPYMADYFDEEESTIKPKINRILEIIRNRKGKDLL